MVTGMCPAVLSTTGEGAPEQFWNCMEGKRGVVGESSLIQFQSPLRKFARLIWLQLRRVQPPRPVQNLPNPCQESLLLYPARKPVRLLPLSRPNLPRCVPRVTGVCLLPWRGLWNPPWFLPSLARHRLLMRTTGRKSPVRVLLKKPALLLPLLPWQRNPPGRRVHFYLPEPLSRNTLHSRPLPTLPRALLKRQIPTAVPKTTRLAFRGAERPRRVAMHVGIPSGFPRIAHPMFVWDYGRVATWKLLPVLKPIVATDSSVSVPIGGSNVRYPKKWSVELYRELLNMTSLGLLLLSSLVSPWTSHLLPTWTSLVVVVDCWPQWPPNENLDAIVVLVQVSGTIFLVEIESRLSSKSGAKPRLTSTGCLLAADGGFGTPLIKRRASPKEALESRTDVCQHNHASVRCVGGLATPEIWFCDGRGRRLTGFERLPNESLGMTGF